MIETRKDSQKVTCPYCSEQYEITLYTQVNAVTDPELKELIITGKLFESECPHCGRVQYMTYDCVYTDDLKKELVLLGSTDNSRDDFVPYLRKVMAARPSEYDFLRAVFAPEQLAEKVLEKEYDADDRIVEIAKSAVLRDLEKEAPHKKVLGLIYNLARDDHGREAEGFMIVDGHHVASDFVPLKQNAISMLEDRYGSLLNNPETEPVIDQNWAAEFLKANRQAPLPEEPVIDLF